MSGKLAVLDNRLFQTSAAMNSTTNHAANIRDTLQSKINSEFEIASTYYTIQKYNRTTLAWDIIGVRLEKPFNLKETNTIKDDIYKLIYKNSTDYTNYLGDLFEFDGYRWMTHDVGQIKSATNSCEIKRCNVQLKFVESTPLISDIIIIDGIADSKTFDADSGNYINLPNSMMEVFVPNNANAKKIKFGNTYHRFLLGIKNEAGRYQAWKVVGVDYISYIRQDFYSDSPSDTNGMIKIRLQVDSTSLPGDNHTVGVAWQNWFPKG